jgi:class I fructose-bisphosphate aldolase
MPSKRVDEIMSWYSGMTYPQQENLLKIINFGRIKDTGKFVILPVDQGFEHGPDASFLPNPEGYNPVYHPRLL